MPNQATASDLLFYDIFVPQKVPLFSKNFVDVIAYDLWFGPPIKNPRYAYASGDRPGLSSILVDQFAHCTLTSLTCFLNHTIKLFCTIFLHQCFLSYHTWTQFSWLASSRTEASGFFSKQIAEAITRIFFSVKAFTQLLRNFFEICCGNSTTMRFVDSLFLIYENDTSSFTKVKSCSYSKKQLFEFCRKLREQAMKFFFDLQWNEIDKWKMQKSLLVLNSIAYRVAFLCYVIYHQ